jgi:colicin import membrane protein
MDRLQKKCVIASASLHGLLAGALLFGSAFLAPSRKAPDLDVLTVIPATLVDASVSNPGGDPKATQPPPRAPLVKPEPPAPATKPEPKPEVVTKPPAPAVEKPAPVKPADEPDFTKPAPGKRLPNVSTDLVKRKPVTANTSTDSDAGERAQAKAARDAQRKALAGALASISGVASSSTSVEIPGPGGQAFANYAQAVKSVYTQAWVVPADVDDDQATTKASVTIRRDGTVADARIIRPSGNAAVDASVQRTLERVTFVAPFPEGAKEDKRTFTISFNLKAKRQL